MVKASPASKFTTNQVAYNNITFSEVTLTLIKIASLVREAQLSPLPKPPKPQAQNLSKNQKKVAKPNKMSKLQWWCTHPQVVRALSLSAEYPYTSLRCCTYVFIVHVN